MSFLRTAVMRLCVGILCVGMMFAPFLLAACSFGQDAAAAPTSPLPSTPATSVSPAAAAKPDVAKLNDPKPNDLKPSDRKPIDLVPDASGTVPPEQIRDLLRRAEEKDIENEKQERNYTYIQRNEEHHLDRNGGVKKVESRTSEILEIYGEPVERLTAKDDQPLSAGEAKKEEDKIQKIIDKRKNESESDRRKRQEKQEKSREEDRKFVLEVADAFNFRLAGSEVLDGHDAWVLDAEPRPGYQSKNRGAQILSKFKGRVWIDKTEEQWLKLDLTAIDTLSVGFVLARIHKGTHVLVELTKVNDEVWLPKHVQFHIDVRLALLKNYNEDVEQTFRDYKKFRTSTKMTVVGEETRRQ